MTSTKKKIVIIGAGCSGLVAIKTCLDEGLQPICFERDCDLGGLWRYEEGNTKRATVYKSTFINTCKEGLCYSDFPMPKEFPVYMHHTKILEYFHLYADRFNLKKHMVFNTQVISCLKAHDYNETGRWKITVENIQTKYREELVCDGVLVCSGHHTEAYLPTDDCPGLERFKGKVIHSNSYRDSSPFADQKVVVVGAGNSGCDLAVELSRSAKQVYLSTRRGAWVYNRVAKNGRPLDLYLVTRFWIWLVMTFPRILNWYTTYNLNHTFDHAKYGLEPKHGPFSTHFTINDELANRIINGTVMVKGNMKGFTENGVIFADDSQEEVDAIIFATGFSVDFPFLDDDIVKITNHEVNLYRLMWPMNLKHNTLSFVGIVQPTGTVAPTSEIQARWAARVFTGDLKLPCNEEMKIEYESMMQAIRTSFVHTRRHSLQVGYLSYMDMIAKEIDCLPNPWKLITDPALAWEVYFGPFTCPQYRLHGTWKWTGARENIMTKWDRVWFPLKPKERSAKTNVHPATVFCMSVVVLVIAAVIYLIV